jgi:hypothetical protein
MDICNTEKPVEVVRGTHMIKCHLFSKVEKAGEV